MFYLKISKQLFIMISMNELLSNQIADVNMLEPSIQENLNILFEKINVVRTAWGKPMIVTSGLRTMEHHLKIYAGKGITDPKKIPMKSKHLFGQAVDISDPNRELQDWCKQNISLLESTGLWMEDFSVTKNWCHFQIVPPRSGNRFFMP
jgi:hypothetical protein